MDVFAVTERQQAPCEVVEVAPYNEADPKFGDFIRVKFDGEPATRRYTLKKGLNGATPEVGARGFLVLESYLRNEGARDGSGRVYSVEKRRVIALADKAA